MSNERSVWSVTAFTRYLKNLLQNDRQLNRVMIGGEITNFKRHGASGHLYFALKDEGASVNCVMFRSKAEKLAFQPETGVQVIALGAVSIFEKAGTYQLYVDKMMPAGVGQQQLALEKLKQKLSEEGIFKSEAEKRALPRLPDAIGLVTSATGAVVRDMVHVLRRRWPAVNIVLVPAQVQGLGGAESIVAALTQLYLRKDIDLIIVGRGGGSQEDLWNFNEEAVVRAIAASPVPIISAVGHETDFTLADLAADVRAGTPSMAAELAVPDVGVQNLELVRKQQQLTQTMQNHIEQKKLHLKRSLRGTKILDPTHYLASYAMALDQRTTALENSIDRRYDRWRHALDQRLTKLSSLNPVDVLSRGFAICMQNGHIVSRIGQVERHRDISVQLSDGTVVARVEDKHANEE